MLSINTGFEKLGVMDLLPDASIIVSDQNYQNLRPTLKMYQAKTGKLLYKSFDANVPDGMAVVTAASRQYLALSYWSVKILVCELITVRNEVAKVMFLHLSVHRGSASVHAGIPPTHPRAGSPPDQAPPPPGATTPPPLNRRLLLRTVRILLECILVKSYVTFTVSCRCYFVPFRITFKTSIKGQAVYS